MNRTAIIENHARRIHLTSIFASAHAATIERRSALHYYSYAWKHGHVKAVTLLGVEWNYEKEAR